MTRWGFIVEGMNDLRIKRKKEIDQPWMLRATMCFVLVLGALLIICVATGAELFTFKHVLIFSLCSIPLCVLYAELLSPNKKGQQVVAQEQI